MVSNVPDPQLKPAREHHWEKVAEIYKARVTVGIALLLAMVTMTGYALQSVKPEIFLLAALVPLAILALDLLAKWYIATPFIYKSFVSSSRSDDEPIELLFLAYASEDEAQFRSIMDLSPGMQRQNLFRRAYALRHLGLRLVVVLSFSAAEICLWTIYNK